MDTEQETPTQEPAADVSAPVPASTPGEPVQAPALSVEGVTVDGYTFKVDMNLVDDVDNLELINKIENTGYLYGIIEFLQKIIGQDEYDKLKAYFVEKEGKLGLTKLGAIYQAIFEKFDPKG